MRRQYSDNDKAAALTALDANGGNLKRTARELHIPISTLQRWRDGEAISRDVPDLRTQKRGELSERLEDVANQLIDAIPGKLGEAGLQSVITSLAIVLDKRQLLLGQPTDRSAIVDETLTDDQRADRIAALLERARARRDGQTPFHADD